MLNENPTNYIKSKISCQVIQSFYCNMAYSDDIEKTIAKICKGHEQKLQRFMREDFKEIPHVPTIITKCKLGRVHMVK